MTTPHDKALTAAAHEITGYIGGTCCHRTGGLKDDPTCECRQIAEAAISAYLSSIGGVVCAREPVGFGVQRDGRIIGFVPGGPLDYEFRLPEDDLPRIPLHAPIEAGNGGDGRAFAIGDRVRKTKGSSWQGRIVGFYSTELTPVGYCVESEREPGSVQIYPETALEAIHSREGRHKA
ncbi:hypothetical protein GR212_15940 [Rhizobium lusitanum]|uniref:Uncharacterized protein n=1 Tax=Rhizobium lusitanum TaxID=293958 RepID=A0A6L9U6E5_9HYPH|nr:hypothetical protein [Rhizobium lusitanum]